MDPGVTPSSGTAKVQCGVSQARCDLRIENTERDGQAGDPYSSQRDGGLACSAEQREVGSQQQDGSLPFWIFQDITDNQGLGQQVNSCPTDTCICPPKPAGMRLPHRPHSLRGANSAEPHLRYAVKLLGVSGLPQWGLLTSAADLAPSQPPASP